MKLKTDKPVRYGILLVLLIIIFVGALFAAKNFTTETNKAPTVAELQKDIAAKAKTNGSNQNGSQTSNNNGSSRGSSTVGSPTPSTSSTPQTAMPNTGPGQTGLIFITVAIVGFLSHHAWLRRQLKLR